MTAQLVDPATVLEARTAYCPGARVEMPCDFRLRIVEYDDGAALRRFECDACGAVNYD